MNWTCDQTEARLSDYLDGLLEGADHAALEGHSADCPNCAPLLASVRGLVSELHAMEPIDAPPHLIYAILDKTLGPRETVTGWQGLQQFLRGLASPKFAYGMASVFATLFILVGSSVSFKKPKLADLRPANVYRNADRQAHLAYARSVKYVSDLRVVYEIQSKLRQDQNDLQSAPQETLPKPSPEKAPGQTNQQQPAQPRQQNRADELARSVEMLAAECPLVLGRSSR